MKVAGLAVVSVLAFGCQASTVPLLTMDRAQMELRAAQSRVFEGAERDEMLRAVIATLQDLGFVLDDAERALGLVTATKQDGQTLRMTVTVREQAPRQLLVRASAQHGLNLVEDPEAYQAFFASLERSEFLSVRVAR